ncbi:MAG TPA: MarR family transcriptional regulator [Azospirillaceae bacterium]|nr:MarR family transcriptional regulator [Azospirillaceae bacterium]HRQ81568.1 MarR family transcriptional regulator [Azospirillaceae bacterium]
MSDPQRFFLGNLSPEKEAAEAVAATLLRIAGLAQSKGYAEGLKPSQWTALRYFASANTAQRTVSAFASHQGSTRGAASQMVEILVGKGLLVRSPSPEDRRVVRLEPTRAAEQLLARDPLAFLIAAVDELPKDEQRWLAAMLERLLKNMQGGA